MKFRKNRSILLSITIRLILPVTSLLRLHIVIKLFSPNPQGRWEALRDPGKVKKRGPGDNIIMP